MINVGGSNSLQERKVLVWLRNGDEIQSVGADAKNMRVLGANTDMIAIIHVMWEGSQSILYQNIMAET